MTNFEKFLEKSKDNNGYWLINHSELIEDYVEVVAMLRGWDWVIDQINITDSAFTNEVYKLTRRGSM